MGAQASSRSGSVMPCCPAAIAMRLRNSVPIWWPSPREPQWIVTTMSSRSRPKGLGDFLVEDRGDLLHFEIMVAAPKRAHLVALALLRLRRDALRLRVPHPAVFLDALEVFGGAISALDCPFRPAPEHLAHLPVAETDGARAAYTGWNASIERIGKLRLYPHDVDALQARVHAAYTAGDVEAHAARGYDAALRRIERSDAADREAV